jgi:hypothetical protein
LDSGKTALALSWAQHVATTRPGEHVVVLVAEVRGNPALYPDPFVFTCFFFFVCLFVCLFMRMYSN